MDEDVYDLICLALSELRAGNHEDADLLLDRVVNRKWADITECDGQYRMFNPDAPISPFRNFLANALGVQVAVHAPGASASIGATA
jgi:hypothetical protein